MFAPETLKQLSLRVSQYFLDFLESDFKRQQAPRRRIILQTPSGFKAGMALAPYRSLQDQVWEILGKPWDEAEMRIAPRLYLKSLSAPLRLVLQEQVKALTQESIQPVQVAIVKAAKEGLARADTHAEEWISHVRQVLAESLGSQIVRPMLSLIDSAVKDQAYSAVDSIFSAEGDLVEALGEPLDAQLPEMLARLTTSRDPAELTQAAIRLLNIEHVRQTVGTFFESFAASDAFLEFRDIETYVSTSEGNQLYLYIGTIKYGSASYPLLYLPIDVRRDDNHGTYTLKLTNQLYANKRAADFILQELGARQQRQWVSAIPERITYLADEPIVDVVARIIPKIAKSMGLTDDLKVGKGAISQATNTQVSISTSLYFCAFEKADEALLNDYEEMIQQIKTEQPGVVALFQSMVQGVLSENPPSIEAAVHSAWDAQSIDERAVPDTPIPLNEEQQKVLSAIHHPEGRIIVVEGPPGTGKSHTIVAIAADCAFRKKSCLVLSDKPEALEVVHHKLSAAMNEVRRSSDFPNPILRLGTEQANFRRLTSAATLSQIGAQAKAAKANWTHLEADRNVRRQWLRGQIGEVVSAYGTIKTGDLLQLEAAAAALNKACGAPLSDAVESACHDEKPTAAPTDTSAPLDALEKLLLEVLYDEPHRSPQALASVLRIHEFAAELALQLPPQSFAFCRAPVESSIQPLTQIAREVEELRRPLIGYLFQRRKLLRLAERCQQAATFSKSIEFPNDLEALKGALDSARKITAAAALRPGMPFNGVATVLSKTSFPIEGLTELRELAESLGAFGSTPGTEALAHAADGPQAAALWIGAVRYARQVRETRRRFASAPDFEYVAKKTEIEKLNTAMMNAEVDARLISFMENSKADARVLAKLIKERQKFPENKFEAVKNAFPVMIASIREFGEYMPLKENLLDVLVIDEASQVSVAQAFPALLRAKKIVIMGDSKQFANTKASNASIELNQKHRADLEAFFKREISKDADALERLSYFDVKRSVLDFGQLCANYRIMLLKHFRSYKELIHYSSSTFYQGQLQAIKLPTAPLADCIEFQVVDVADDSKFVRNTNPAEAEFILQQCRTLLEADSPPTVGVITPFKEQQSYISKLLASDEHATGFRTRLRIKVMTFDSCQGEERELVFYSMVATRRLDLLNYIFPLQLDNPDETVGEKLKMQRLNVGFSRAQEAVSFVLSKPVAEYKGSIAQALRHFEQMGKGERAGAKDTDQSSPMETKVLNWLYNTPFYQTHSDSIEVLPQFPIGEYLMQLDPTYKHPAWKVDFLVTIATEDRATQVVIEYDGFEYHFRKGVAVDAHNHGQYLNDADVERQLTLESYGYRFLRLNRFNLGKDPVASLSNRLEAIVKLSSRLDDTGAVKVMSQQAEALNDKSEGVRAMRSDKASASLFRPDTRRRSGRHGTDLHVMQARRSTRVAARWSELAEAIANTH